VTGTSDCCTGSVSLNMTLSASVFLTGDQGGDPGGTIPGIQPCPLCTALTCQGGPNNGMACTPGSTDFGDPYPTSQDCPPDPMLLAGVIAYNPSLTTGTVTSTATPATNDTGVEFDQLRVFCGYCRDVDATGSFASPAQQCWENGMAVGAACAGTFETCEQRNNGAFGPGGGAAKTITVNGFTAPGICNPADARLATVFCLPPTFNATLDASWDAPGPAATALQMTTKFCPVANSCP
jgi:hypothetical protein